jgi:glycosyltransferase involved in cell wall biosynthesis
MTTTKPRVAIVCDWILDKGGAELVVAELHKLFPAAPIFTSYCDPSVREKYGDVRTGWLQHFGWLRKFVPFLRIVWFTHLDLRDYDIIISSSGAEAKGVKTAPRQLHINYCHAPTHYYWSRYDEYMQNPGFGKLNFLARFGLRLLAAPLRRWDYAAAQRPDVIIANSNHIKSEIKKYYGRDSTVIFPPIEADMFAPPRDQKREDFYVVIGRQTPYKRNDLAVQACTKLGRQLVVIGDGADLERLKKMAGETVKFVGRIDDASKVDYIRRARGLIFSGVEDFGITMAESLAAGTPVIALNRGGARDIVANDRLGVLFAAQEVSSVMQAIKRAEKIDFDQKFISQSAWKFDVANFDKQIRKVIFPIKG